MALAARKTQVLGNCGPPTKKSDGDENMIRVHKSTNTKHVPIATASIIITERHFNSTQARANNSPRLIRKYNFPFSESYGGNQNFKWQPF